MRVQGYKRESIVLDGLTVDGWVESATVFKRKDGKGVAILVLDKPDITYHNEEANYA